MLDSPGGGGGHLAVRPAGHGGEPGPAAAGGRGADGRDDDRALVAVPAGLGRRRGAGRGRGPDRRPRPGRDAGDADPVRRPDRPGDLVTPAGPPQWWDEIRAGLPAYDPLATPCRGMGAVPDCFRACAGVRRSAHPTDSFAARGPGADRLLDPHPLPYGVGEGSPLSRLYDAAGHVLLLGVGHGNNTPLHLAEHRSGRGRETLGGSPVLVDGQRQWVRYPTRFRTHRR